VAGAGGFEPPKAGALPKCTWRMLVLLGFIFLGFYKPGARVERMW